MPRLASNVLPLIAVTVLGLPSCERSSDAPTSLETDNSESEDPKGGGSGAKVTSISGPGGITSPDLAAGTFVGAGGRFDAGVRLETAKGTLAELELDRGGHLYMNEDTRLSLPGGDHPGAVSLDRGELVATTTADAGDVVVQTGDDALTLESGEVQVRAEGDTHRFAVVHGHASLVSGDRTVALSAGDTIETPLPELAQAEPPTPTRSLSPLRETGWARTFDAAASIADSVPRGVGSLTARQAGSKTERQGMRLTQHTVTVNISGRVAHTEVEQAFFNDQPSVLEGIYRFPIPEDGSISGLSLLVGNTWMNAEVVEKQRARRIFQQIVDATVPRDPALLEWERGNVFKLRIFPIPGRGERQVKLSYTQVLPVVGGKLRYRYPLGGSGATGTPIDNFAFTVRLDGSEIPADRLDDITTPMLALERRDDNNIIELHTQREAFLPTYDLGVDIPVPEAERPVHSRTFLDQDGQAYFMVAMEPQFEMGTDERPVHYAFVLDRSHSTSPELWTTARGVVDAMTELMDEDDRFTVLACDSACEEHQDGLAAPTSEAVGRAQQFLDNQDLAGASDLAGSLQQAADALERSGSSAQHVVVYLGDGVPTSGEMAPDGITDLLRAPMANTRVLAVALGSRSDLTALQAVVDVTGGDLVQADARDDLRAMVRELRLRAEVPALRNATLDLPEGMVMARMNNVSAIRPGDTVVVTGKLHHRVAGDIVLRGNGPGGDVSASFPVELSASQASTSTTDSHLPRTWAKMQIQHLTKTQGFRAKDDIIALSKDYTVLSRHTALLVLENDAMFREFNVVRSAKNTAKWDGNLESKRKQVPGTARGAEKKEAPSSGSTASDVEDEAGLIGGLLRGSTADLRKNGGSTQSGPTPTLPAGGAADGDEEADERFDDKTDPFAFKGEPDPEPEAEPQPDASGADRDNLDEVMA
ncbi:MAG: FecR domain-containing protein, partial [Nannocystaceae bacterium]|nr:FecR domain-containing protein [Nannocystaceae bacterium]